MEQTDYYATLDVSKDADATTIRDAYRKLALIHHPDRNRNNPEAAEKMKAVNEAYAVLSDPDKRRNYDAMKNSFGAGATHRFRQDYTDQDIFKGTDIHAIFEELAKDFGFRGGDAIFKEFYGSGWKSFHVSRPGFFMKGSFFRSSGGGDRRSVGDQGAGGGFLGGQAASLLGSLLSKGAKKGGDVMDTITIEKSLAASGGPFAYFHKARGKKLVVKIPPGVREGQRIRLTGMGKEGKGSGGSGNLYLKVTYKKSLWERLVNLVGSVGRFGNDK
ncbi:J domain-containing protein [Desulfoluna spongiiphila]|uniref:Curved DNA-binding protein n=1 Tax=Desulfoluna spongiiphila TaxID=419481 RepID=A0A1G5I821_9BACT|nr:DnaJ domain-containing protein [Desulfoluna spongiiphila]SCY72117.1 curved DNA-binding protein [Desulfoluna spongiiphila]